MLGILAVGLAVLLVALVVWAATAAAHDLELQVEATASTDPVWCARADLDRALDAVIENAILYGAGGRHVTIRAAGRAIEVLDEGAGLAPGEEQALFGRFRRGSAGAGAPNGTGLGLAIARELMRCWNGDAALANRDGAGARATLTLPPFTGSLPSVLTRLWARCENARSGFPRACSGWPSRSRWRC